MPRKEGKPLKLSQITVAARGDGVSLLYGLTSAGDVYVFDEHVWHPLPMMWLAFDERD